MQSYKYSKIRDVTQGCDSFLVGSNFLLPRSHSQALFFPFPIQAPFFSFPCSSTIPKLGFKSSFFLSKFLTLGQCLGDPSSANHMWSNEKLYSIFTLTCFSHVGFLVGMCNSHATFHPKTNVCQWNYVMNCTTWKV